MAGSHEPQDGVRHRVPEPSELVRVVALDGPAGSGKTTVARLTAEALGWRFVDTGATYRAVALAVLRAGAPSTHGLLATAYDYSDSAEHREGIADFLAKRTPNF